MWNPFKRERGAATQDFKRYNGTGVCDVCNAELTPGEAFLVPTEIFWNSKKYKDWLWNNPMTRGMIQMAGVTVGQHIALQKKMDQTEHSGVCPDCIHLFR